MTYNFKKPELVEAITLMPETTTTPTLLEILSYRRGFETEGEVTFIKKHIKPLSKKEDLLFVEDAFGNILVTVPDTMWDKPPRILHNAHTDSCHSSRNPSVYQSLALCDDGMIRLLDEVNYKRKEVPKPAKIGRNVKQKKADRVHSTFGEVLGSDDGTGIYIMLQMIEARVPGYYLFTRGEEVGGQGVNYLMQDEEQTILSCLPDYLELVISYDRKDLGSIITEQSCGVCMGNDAAGIFSSMLYDKWLEADQEKIYSGVFKADPTGSYTDSAAFVDMAKHCTNLSVGYYRQHSSMEYQDPAFAELLAQVLVELDWYALEDYLENLTEKPEDTYLDERDWWGTGNRSTWNTLTVSETVKVDKTYEPEDDYTRLDEINEFGITVKEAMLASPYCPSCPARFDASFDSPECAACGGLEDGAFFVYRTKPDADTGEDE